MIDHLIPDIPRLYSAIAEWIHGTDGRCQPVLLASVYDRSRASYAAFHLCILFD